MLKKSGENQSNLKQTRKKNISTKLLAKRALKNGPKWKPAKGYKYLQDLDIGSVFETAGGMKGILIECEMNAKVIIIDVDVPDADKDYYLGKHTIGAQTEVKEM